MDKKFNSRGEILTSKLVGLVLLIVCLAVIFLGYSQFLENVEIDKEACAASVNTRALVPSAGDLKNKIPLKCQTSKYCLGEDSSFFGTDFECEEFEGGRDVEVETASGVSKFISEEVIDCWNMMGKGKTSVFSNWIAEDYGFGEVYPSCIVCSRIAFDKDFDANILREVNVEEYMRTHRIPTGNISYWEYFVGENDAKISFEGDLILPKVEEGKVFVDEKTGVEKGDSINLEEVKVTFNDPSESAELAVVFTQFSVPIAKEAAWNLAEAGLIGGFVIGSNSITSKIFSKTVGFTGVYGKVAAALAVVGTAGYQQWNIAENRGVSAGYCGDLVVGSGSREGCSTIRVVNYNAEDLKQYCSIIESLS